LLQTNGQALLDCQSPADVQVWGTLPLQPVCPGWQTPEQTPLLQTNGQVAPVSQVPSALQVCGAPDELHCRAPGWQTPAQSP
jgi:hypothetical protein